MPCSTISITCTSDNSVASQNSARSNRTITGSLMIGLLLISESKILSRIESGFFRQLLPQRLDVMVEFLRHHRLELHEQVTTVPGLVHQAVAFGAHALAILAAGRHLEVDLAGQG